jgi:hypothetical protein
VREQRDEREGARDGRRGGEISFESEDMRERMERG